MHDMTTSLTPISLIKVAPPAAWKEPTMNGLLDEDLRLTVDVPQITLRDKDLLVRDPDGKEGTWRVTGQSRDEDGRLVVAYTTLDGGTGEFTFPDPDAWVRVDVGPVGK